MRILAIDGGGIRGVFAAHVLKRIQEEYGVNFQELFGLIAGTSTGSIIAAALASGQSIDDVVKLYEGLARRIFPPRPWWRVGLFRSKYSSDRLREELEAFFGDLRLSDIKTRLLIPATDISNGTVHVFKSTYDPDFKRDPNVRVSDAVLASCSAPLFFDPTVVSPYLLSDGGLWANNPSLAAVAEAKHRLNCQLHEIKLLSLGTGVGENYYTHRSRRAWGFLGRWKHTKLVSMLLNLQVISAENYVKALVSQEDYVRVSFVSKRAEALDDVDALQDLISKADEVFSKKASEIAKVLGV